MNEQTKTQLAHSAEVAALKNQIEALNLQLQERNNMTNLLHKHIGDLNAQKEVASQCHDARIKDLHDQSIQITQLQNAFTLLIAYLKSDASSKYVPMHLKHYADRIIDVTNGIHHECTGKYIDAENY